MKKILNWFTRWQVYFYIGAAIILLTSCIATVAPNGISLLPILAVIIAIAIKTGKDIIIMFKSIMNDEKNNGAD